MAGSVGFPSKPSGCRSVNSRHNFRAIGHGGGGNFYHPCARYGTPDNVLDLGPERIHDSTDAPPGFFVAL
jgi:hypothetical protein